MDITIRIPGRARAEEKSPDSIPSHRAVEAKAAVRTMGRDMDRIRDKGTVMDNIMAKVSQYHGYSDHSQGRGKTSAKGFEHGKTGKGGKSGPTSGPAKVPPSWLVANCTSSGEIS